MSRKKYVVESEECKSKPKLNEIIKYKWHEKHIILLRDNPEFRLIVELLMLFGYIGIIIFIYMEINKLTLTFNKIFRAIIAIIFGLWFGLIFAYTDVYQKLKSDKKFYLEKNH